MLADLAAFALDSFAPELRRLAGGIATNGLARISFLDLKMLQDKPPSQQKFHTKSEATQITGFCCYKTRLKSCVLPERGFWEQVSKQEV